MPTGKNQLHYYYSGMHVYRHRNLQNGQIGLENAPFQQEKRLCSFFGEVSCWVRVQNGRHSVQHLKFGNPVLARFHFIRQLCPVARRLFYLSIIQPDFDFGSSAFIPNILMSQRKRLVATWRRAVRAVAGSGYKEDVAPLLKELMIDPIEHRWAQP